MPAISFEKIIVPAERDIIMTRSSNYQALNNPTLSRQTLNQASTQQASGLPGQKLTRKSATTLGRGRGIVVNWLDRLVERRMEKVERDIARIRKKKTASETL